LRTGYLKEDSPRRSELHSNRQQQQQQHLNEGEISKMFEDFNTIFRGIFGEIEKGNFQIPFNDEMKREKHDAEKCDTDLRKEMLENKRPDNKSWEIPKDEENERYNFLFDMDQLFKQPNFQPKFHGRNEDGDEEEDERLEMSFHSIFPWPQMFDDKHLRDPSSSLYGSVGKEGDFSSAYKFSTITKKIKPDGSVETITKRQDSDGNVEEITRKTIGDQTYTRTEKQKAGKEIETTEDFINIDQGDLKQFEEKWKDKKQGNLRKDFILDSPDQENV